MRNSFSTFKDPLCQCCPPLIDQMKPALLKVSPSTTQCVSFPRLESFGHKPTPFHFSFDWGLQPEIAASVKMDAFHFPGCPLGASAATQTSLLTVASHSHRNRLSLHSSSFGPLQVQVDFFKV